MTWTTIVILICLLLAALMVWREAARVNRLRLPLRLLASVIAAAALACIALPISYTAKTVTGAKDGVLLTSEFNKDSLKAYQNGRLFTTEKAIQKANLRFKITLIADLSDIASNQYNISKLHVLGYGLTGDELKALNHFPIQFHPAKPAPGIIAINWNHHVKSGESLKIQGRFTGATTNTTIVLKGLNTTLDSITILKGAGRNSVNNSNSVDSDSDVFQLKSIPKNTGKATYSLIVLSGKDTIEQETIPFEVEPAKPLKVLMLATSPDFENKFLKNWLVQQGYTLAVRTAISKEKFSREYFNMAQTPIDQLTPALLEKFDLVVGDLSAYTLLSGAENNAIQQQMMQKGLGIIVKADSVAKGTSFLANSFPLDRLSDKTQKQSALSIGGQSPAIAKLNLDPVFIKYQPNTQPLVNDEQKHVIASSTIYGSGKIVFSTLGNTYNWMLAGNQTDYTSLWSMLIDKAVRKTEAAQQWLASPRLPVVNEPVVLMVNGLSSLPMQVKAGTSNIAFIQNPLLPFSWEATYWPENTGWQQVTQNGTVVYNWYAFAETDWASLHAREKIQQTEQYANHNKVKSKAASAEENTIQVKVSKIYFYILLLLSCIYLWIERKL